MRQHPFLSDVQYGSEYDVVVAKDVLFTLHDPGRAVSEWISLLKPGRKLLIMDGNYFYDTVLDEYRKRRDYFQTKYGKEEVEVLAGQGGRHLKSAMVGCPQRNSPHPFISESSRYLHPPRPTRLLSMNSPFLA